MAHWPDHRIVKVRMDKGCWNGYPYKITSLEPSITIRNGIPMYSDAHCDDGFYVSDFSLVTLYPTRRKAEKAQLEVIHQQYADQRRELRNAQTRYKNALKRLQEYKAFKQLQTTVFI